MEMSDYKEMYLKMVRASERAINILIEAQRECEELYISGHERSAGAFTTDQSRLRGAGDWSCVQTPADRSRKETAPEPRDSPGADG